MENNRKVLHEFESINCNDSYNKMIEKQKDRKFKELCSKFSTQLKESRTERERNQYEEYNHGKYY